MKPIRVVELFAGVGGFRIGLEGYPKKKNSPYEVVWSNQWEPKTKTQHANLVYKNRWPNSNHSGENIEEVILNNFDSIKDHDLLVGGFPCQDYSVATTLKNSKGLRGKKGVLWWSIEAILRKKEDKKPKYLILENVDRLLQSPSNQRGRDFAVMLSSLNNLDYAVEWRVINAAEYGMPQRRRRIFIIGYHKSTSQYKKIEKLTKKEDWLYDKGLFAKAFPITKNKKEAFKDHIDSDIIKLSESFNKKKKISPFQNSGLMIQNSFWTLRTEPDYKGDSAHLGHFVLDLKDVPKEYIIPESELNKEKGWKWHKNAKKIIRTNKEGHTYTFAEGGMAFPDPLNKPSRTIITGEGGKSASRFKHVIKQGVKFRRLTPLELERLNMFPDNHTELKGIPDTKRAFFMGNALVVGVIEKLGEQLIKEIK